jgi:hypothetical protein
MPQLVEQQGLMLLVFVIVEMRDRYGKTPGWRGRDWFTFETLDEPIDPWGLYGTISRFLKLLIAKISRCRAFGYGCRKREKGGGRPFTSDESRQPGRGLATAQASSPRVLFRVPA